MSINVHGAIKLCVCACVVNADTVDWNEVKVTHNRDEKNTVHIGWHDPRSPNGVILFYELQFTRADIANVRTASSLTNHKLSSIQHYLALCIPISQIAVLMYENG